MIAAKSAGFILYSLLTQPKIRDYIEVGNGESD